MLKKVIFDAFKSLFKLNLGMVVFYFLIQYFLKFKAANSSLLFIFLAINTFYLITLGNIIWVGYKKMKNDLSSTHQG
jgi:hypothetical protein